MKHVLRRALVGAAAAVLVISAPAFAHDVEGSKLSDDGAMNSGKPLLTRSWRHGWSVAIRGGKLIRTAA